MIATYKIAEVARRSGFKPSALRYYEKLGLVSPSGRSEAGYRFYDERSLSRLAVISRAKQLGCRLDEITDLLAAWEGDRCEPVQARLRELIAAKMGEARSRIGELVSFFAQLQQAASSLGEHTPDGPCDADCGCTSVSETAIVPTPLRLRESPTQPKPAIACTLGASDIAGRLAAWRSVLAPVVSREPIDNGLRLVYPRGSPLSTVVELAAAEQGCCMFFRFAITIDGRGTALEVTAPVDAQAQVMALFGAPW
ncbi:MAG: MerR family transcriptional regulator [Acidimicrobiales bacterium]